MVKLDECFQYATVVNALKPLSNDMVEINICLYGSCSFGCPEPKNIHIIGALSSGKPTLISALATYFENKSNLTWRAVAIRKPSLVLLLRPLTCRLICRPTSLTSLAKSATTYISNYSKNPLYVRHSSGLSIPVSECWKYGSSLIG